MQHCITSPQVEIDSSAHFGTNGFYWYRIECDHLPILHSNRYLLTLTNLVYCIQHGFDWFAYVAFGLTVLCLCLDILGGKRDGKDE